MRKIEDVSPPDRGRDAFTASALSILAAIVHFSLLCLRGLERVTAAMKDASVITGASACR